MNVKIYNKEQLLLTKALNAQDSLWKEKARNQTFIHGDRNTSYFHRVTKVRAVSKNLTMLQDGDNILTEPDAIEGHVLSYFQSIFSVSNNCASNDMVERLIPNMITAAENEILCRVPLSSEVKAAVFDLNGDGAPGPDGFGGHFYQTFWDIVALDVVNSVQEFFLTGSLATNVNSNLIVLVPKSSGAKAMGDFRPIGLANFQFKIITKILADRLALIAMRIVSVEQRGFIKERNIADCVILASEAVNGIDRKQVGGNIALKVDISKAFDTLDWDFLIAVLTQFGFSLVFTQWIRTILHSARLSILVNAKVVGFFPCSRGVRQGDPLSPLLFCLAEEVLSRAISDAHDEGRLSPMVYARGIAFPTHILYADDIMIFCSGTKRNIRCLLNIFLEYSTVSGQLVNRNKSRFYTGAMTNSRVQMLAAMLGFCAGSIPFTYLGCPIFKGKQKASQFLSIIDKIKAKLATWKGTTLSIMGRIQLVKSIIHGMLVYSFNVYMWPRRLLCSLDSWIKNFIWSGDIHSRKICTVSWKIMCRPWEAGGLDIKSTRMINDSLMLKLAWELASRDCQWSALLKCKYFSNGRPCKRYMKSSIWASIKMHLSTVYSNSIWIVGTGENINLWVDNWLGEPLIDMLQIDPDLSTCFTGLVVDVIQDGRWNLPGSLVPLVSHLLDSVVLSSAPLPDMLAWQHSTDGTLTAKQAKVFMTPAAPVLVWPSLIWRPCIPPSHAFIYWRCFHGKMPTDDNLKTRGCVMASVCNFCMNSEESSDHLFLRCSFALALWSWIGGKLHCGINLTSIASIFDCVPARCSSQIADIYVAAVTHTLHIIWLSRNSLRFSSDVVSLHAAKVRLHAAISMSGNLSVGHSLQSDLPILEAFNIAARHRNFKDIIAVVWKAPSHPWLKVNTDGSVVGNSAACGGIFRDHLGSFRGAFTCNLGPDTVFSSEIQGYIFAMEFAAHNGWYNVWLESDSSSGLAALKNHALVPVMLRNRWHNACRLGVQVISSHIYREGNVCADRLANMGHSVQGAVWLSSLPPLLGSDFFRDRCGLPNYRFP
jgi:ribonuclease HI